MLVGHSFGASTALAAAARLGEGAVGAVLGFDPYISGYDASSCGAAAVPTLALMTPTMMPHWNTVPCGESLAAAAAQGVSTQPQFCSPALLKPLTSSSETAHQLFLKPLSRA